MHRREPAMSSALTNPGDEDAVALLWHPGDVILDLYDVLEVVESGGMGLVYRVRHRGWDIELAVKAPRPKLVTSAAQHRDFEAEAEAWARLGSHPHTVSCAYVRRLGGVPRVFAEWVDGGSLADWVRDRRLYEGGPRAALQRILDVAIQFAWGLEHAHEHDLVHQDIKPANVMLTRDGVAKVTDFGLAKARAGRTERGAPDARHGRLVMGAERAGAVRGRPAVRIWSGWRRGVRSVHRRRTSRFTDPGDAEGPDRTAR
jgi:serine/threonine protein kinase